MSPSREEDATAHDALVVGEFSHQAENFHRFAASSLGETVDALVRLAAPAADERWLDGACGPGVVAQALARTAREVHGIDATPAMIDVAQRSSEALGLENATFDVGDATNTGLPSGSFDGAVSRFAVHHIAVPGRLVAELARLVHARGRVVLADHVADPDLDAFMWSQEIERLRDPSHWMSLTAGRLRELGGAAGLSLESEEVMPIHVDFEDWLARGSGGPGARRLIERRLAERPEGSGCFRVVEVDGHRWLALTMWLSLWQR